MEMKQIVKELENKLEEAKTQVEDWEAKEKFYTEAANAANKELELLKDNITSLEMMIEASKEGHFGLNGAKADKPKQEPKAVKPKEVEVDPKHKRAGVYKINRYDNIEDRWRSQRAAAKALGWDQSGLSKFMKLNKDTQINKKGFALVWEY